MELKQLIEKWTKEMADIKSHIKQHEDTFGHPAVTSRERLEAISDMLADVKQLNLPPVSNNELTVCEYRDICKYIAENGNCSIKCKHYGH